MRWMLEANVIEQRQMTCGVAAADDIYVINIRKKIFKNV